MIREPNESEIDKCVELIYTAGPYMFNYFLASEPPKVYDLIKVFYTKPDVLFSHTNVLVKIENGEVCGLLLSLPTKDMEQMAKNMMKYGKELLSKTGFFGAIKMVFRSGLQRYLDVNGTDEYYVSNLAVFEKHRGKGIGTELLKKAEELAKENGYKKLSLVVEHYNKNAKRVYEKFGFKEELNVILPKKYHKHNLDGFYKMVKVL